MQIKPTLSLHSHNTVQGAEPVAFPKHAKDACSEMIARRLLKHDGTLVTLHIATRADLLMLGHSGCALQAAAVGVPSNGGGPEQLVLFLVQKKPQPLQVHHHQQQQQQQQDDVTCEDVQQPLLSACQAAIRTKMSPLFRVSRVVVRASLPRNASNKVMRRLLRDEATQARATTAAVPPRGRPSSKL